MVLAAGPMSLNAPAPGPDGLTSTPIRVAEGTSSRSSSSRFEVNSTFKKLIPVRLPPGRARLATSPSFTGSSAIAKTIGIVEVASLRGERANDSFRSNHGHWPADQFGDERGQPIDLILGEAIRNRHVLTFDVTESPSGPGEMHGNGRRRRRAIGSGGARSPASPAAARARRAATLLLHHREHRENSRRLMSAPKVRTEHRIGSDECFDRG